MNQTPNPESSTERVYTLSPSLKKYATLLNVGMTVTKAQVNKAAKKLMKKYHPDINKEEGAQETFQNINNAKDEITTYMDNVDTNTSQSGTQHSSNDEFESLFFHQNVQSLQRFITQCAKYDNSVALINKMDIWGSKELIISYLNRQEQTEIITIIKTKYIELFNPTSSFVRRVTYGASADSMLKQLFQKRQKEKELKLERIKQNKLQNIGIIFKTLVGREMTEGELRSCLGYTEYSVIVSSELKDLLSQFDDATINVNSDTLNPLQAVEYIVEKQNKMNPEDIALLLDIIKDGENFKVWQKTQETFKNEVLEFERQLTELQDLQNENLNIRTLYQTIFGYSGMESEVYVSPLFGRYINEYKRNIPSSNNDLKKIKGFNWDDLQKIPDLIKRVTAQNLKFREKIAEFETKKHEVIQSYRTIYTEITSKRDILANLVPGYIQLYKESSEAYSKQYDILREFKQKRFDLKSNKQIEFENKAHTVSSSIDLDGHWWFESSLERYNNELKVLQGPSEVVIDSQSRLSDLSNTVSKLQRMKNDIDADIEKIKNGEAVFNKQFITLQDTNKELENLYNTHKRKGLRKGVVSVFQFFGLKR